MIQLNTILTAVDNSGAKSVKCIKILGGSFCGRVGDIMMVAVQKALSQRKVRSGEVHRSLIVRTKKELHRKDGSTLNFFTNSAIILNDKNIPQSTRILGPIPRELRQQKFMKVLSIAQGTL